MNTGYGQKDSLPAEALKLGNVLSEYLEKQVRPLQKQWVKIEHVWQGLVPENIARMCSIEGFEDGVLTIGVVSQGYAHEIRLISTELIEHLNMNLKNVKIRQIRTILKHGR